MKTFQSLLNHLLTTPIPYSTPQPFTLSTPVRISPSQFAEYFTTESIECNILISVVNKLIHITDTCYCLQYNDIYNYISLYRNGKNALRIDLQVVETIVLHADEHTISLYFSDVPDCPIGSCETSITLYQ